MNWRILTLHCLIGLSVAACSKSNSSTSGTVPTPTDPSPVASPTPVIPGTSTPIDPHAANLANAVAINLTDRTNYLGLGDISGSGGLSGNVFLPLVGDAKINLRVTNTRSQTINGTLVLAFEDQQGFWEASWDSVFPGTGAHVTSGGTNSIDLIFADDDLVVRTVGIITNNTLNGQIYYRMRQSGDTACKVQRCQMTLWNGTVVECPANLLPETVTPCRNYMNLSDTHVKQLGVFQTNYSTIATLPEVP